MSTRWPIAEAGDWSQLHRNMGGRDEMPRAQAREARAEDADEQVVAPGGGDDDDLLQGIVAGLIARLRDQPLMGRAPAGCSPEEQERLIELLRGLSDLRASLAALGPIPIVSRALAEEVWPELAAALGVATPAPRGGAQGGAAAAQPPPMRQDQPPPTTPDVAFSPAEATPTGPGRRDLREQVRVVLHTDNRPWSGARIASRLQEADPLATREEVYNTLHRHSDLFRRTGHGWELISR